MADKPLWLWSARRSIPRTLCAMGLGGHSLQGSDTNSVQNRDDHERAFGLQPAALRSPFFFDARRKVFLHSGVAQALCRADQRSARKIFWLVFGDPFACRGDRILDCRACNLTVAMRPNVSLLIALFILVIAAASIAGTFAFEAFGYLPCELCLKERIPYYAAIPLSV